MTEPTTPASPAAVTPDAADDPKNRRSVLMRDPAMNVQFTASVVATFVMGGTVVALFLLARDFVVEDPWTLASMVLVMSFAPAAGVQAILHMHRFAGPAFRLRKHLEAVLAGDLEQPDVVLRKKDYLKDLAATVNAIAALVRRRRDDARTAREAIDAALAALEGDAADADAATAKLGEARATLDRLAA